MGTIEYTPERRPITSRDRKISIRLATRVAGWGVTPNAISVVGMIAGILAGVAFALSRRPGWGMIGCLSAAAFMQLRLLANMLDGMVALQTHRASPVGELFNEVPDRVSDTAIFIGAGYAVGGCPTLGFLASIGALFTAYIRAEGKVAGAHQEFCGPMAKPQRMALMTAAAVYTVLAPSAWQPRFTAWPEVGTIAVTLLLIAIGCAVTSLRRLLRVARVLQKEKP